MRINRWQTIIILVLAFAGFLDATYLTIHHYLNISLPCILLKGCDVVTRSSYSLILGVPVALLGALYYLAIIILVILYLDKAWRFSLALIGLILSLGLLFSLWFLYVQAFILNSFCLYCVGSAGITFTLFIFFIVIRLKSNN